jgi:hypothetical protein
MHLIGGSFLLVWGAFALFIMLFVDLLGSSGACLFASLAEKDGRRVDLSDPCLSDSYLSDPRKHSEGFPEIIMQ